MNQVKWLRLSLVLLLVLGLAIPAMATGRNPRLSDSQQPGSVIVFPKFIRGTVLVDGVESRPQTEFEIGVLCPPGVTCTEHTVVKIHFHWVCPGSQDFASKYICPEVDFDLTATYFGKLVIGTDGTVNTAGVSGVFANTSVPVPPCDRGYLIGWVVNTADQPIKFDGLIGDAILRESETVVAAYNAITIQAHPDLATNAAITLTPEGGLIFDGEPGHYLAVTGKIYGDVKYDNPPFDGTVPTRIRSLTYLTLLTLDVRSNRPNLPTFVDLKFYNENERLVSTFTEFICWEEVSLSSINPSLTQSGMGSRKGVVVSGAASKERPFGLEEDADAQAVAASDTPGPVTLLGFVETDEVGLDGTILREYAYLLYNDSVPVLTTFFPAN